MKTHLKKMIIKPLLIAALALPIGLTANIAVAEAGSRAHSGKHYGHKAKRHHRAKYVRKHHRKVRYSKRHVGHRHKAAMRHRVAKRHVVRNHHRKPIIRGSRHVVRHSSPVISHQRVVSHSRSVSHSYNSGVKIAVGVRYGSVSHGAVSISHGHHGHSTAHGHSGHRHHTGHYHRVRGKKVICYKGH